MRIVFRNVQELQMRHTKFINYPIGHIILCWFCKYSYIIYYSSLHNASDNICLCFSLQKCLHFIKSSLLFFYLLHDCWLQGTNTGFLFNFSIIHISAFAVNLVHCASVTLLQVFLEKGRS